MADNLIRPRVFLDVQIGTQPAGRIVIELFTDKTPKTCENFRFLCNSSYTPKGASKPLSYKLSPFHRIIDEFMVQGGDITTGDGTGGQSIYGKEFADENIGWREIDSDGLACMANRGKDTNTSQFFITLTPCQHLNAKHTIFGHVVSGIDVVKQMATVDVDKSDRPVEPVIVTHCGELERRKKAAATAYVHSRTIARDEAHTISSDRGRKRTKSSRFESPSASMSRSDSSRDRHSRKKHHKDHISPQSPAQNSRRRSDTQIDETRRGRAQSRSQSPYGSEIKPSLTGHRRRKRSISPSRSHSPPASPSPHLRRRHKRSRDRSRAASQSKPRDYKHSPRPDEHLIQRKEQERKISRDRYKGVVEEGYDGGGQRRRSEHYRRGELQGRSQGGYGRLGGRGGGDDTDGEIKFKGRGRMKYREKKW